MSPPLDFTARMIRVPIQLQEQGYVRYTMKMKESCFSIVTLYFQIMVV